MKYWFLALFLMVPGLVSASNQLIVKQKIVEFTHPLGVSVVGVPVTNLGLQYYYEIKTPQELTDEEIDRIADKILDKFDVDTDVDADVDTDNIEIEPETQYVPNTPVEGDAELKIKVEDIALTKCVGCHKADSDSGFEMITDGHLNPALTKLDWWNIFDHIDGSHLPKEEIMPKNGDPLPQEEVDLFRFYVRSLK